MATNRKDLRIRLGGPGYCGDLVGDSTNEVHAAFPPDDKNDAINDAVRLSDWRFPRRLTHEGFFITSGNYTYPISSASVSPAIDRVAGIDALEYNSGASTAGWQRFDPNWWFVRDENGTLKLQLNRLPMTSTTLRIIYRARPLTLTADTSTLDPDDTTFTNFICAKAAGLLFERLSGKIQDNESVKWANEAVRYHNEANAIAAPPGMAPPKGK